MKPGAIILIAVFGALPGRFQSCDSDESPESSVGEVACPALNVARAPDHFPSLCGTESTAVPCATIVPRYPSDVLFPGPFALIESMSGMERFPVGLEDGDSRIWLLEEISQGMARVKDVPDYYGIAIAKPPALLRSDRIVPVEGSRMSLYFCVSDIRDECVVDSVVAISWTVKRDEAKFTDLFEAAGRVFHFQGVCPDDVKVGDSWKTWGELYLPEG